MDQEKLISRKEEEEFEKQLCKTQSKFKESLVENEISKLREHEVFEEN